MKTEMQHEAKCSVSTAAWWRCGSKHTTASGFSLGLNRTAGDRFNEAAAGHVQILLIRTKQNIHSLIKWKYYNIHH